MSYSPQRFFLREPTTAGPELWQLAVSPVGGGSSPKLAPDRAAYSHSASVGRRKTFPVRRLSVSTKLFAIAKLTPMTGRREPFKVLGLLPSIIFHCSWVTS